MLEQHTKKDIEKVSHDVLKGSKSFDVFPTPVDKLVTYSDLVINNDINLSVIHQSFLESASEALLSGLAKIRGILDRREKVIYLDLDLADTKRNFVKLHEVGHEVLPWQKNIHEFLDNDTTLSENTREAFEAEANYFASATLFQLDRFEHEMNRLEFGIKTPMVLAKHFGASIHASLRKFVESTKNRCGLIVLENISAPGLFVKCSVRDCFLSSQFLKELGDIVLPSEVGYKWAFVKDYYFQKRFHERGPSIY